jgi:hypothetical protein
MTDNNRISQLINTPDPEGGSAAPPPSPPPGTTTAPTPTPTPSPPAPGGGSGEVRNDPNSIENLGRALVANVGPKLQQAATDIGALHLAESAYTAVTYSLAIAYTEASAFMIQDLGSKVERLGEIGAGLHTTAATWREAEDSSTVRGV